MVVFLVVTCSSSTSTSRRKRNKWVQSLLMIVFVCWSHFHTNGTRSGEKHYSWGIVLRTVSSYI